MPWERSSSGFQKNLKLITDTGLQAVTSPCCKETGHCKPPACTIWPCRRGVAPLLRSLGRTSEEKLIYGENISQTAQFAHTGAADAGIIALSLAISPKMLHEGRYWVIPDESHSDIEQIYLVLKKGEGKKSIRKFLDFIHGEKGG